MKPRVGLDGVGVVVVGYGHTELSPAVADLLPKCGDAVVVVNPRGDAASVVPDVVRSIETESNVGYAAAVNRGESALAATCDVVVVLTHDADIGEDDLERLVATLWARDECAVVGPALRIGDQLRVGGDHLGPGRVRHRIGESNGSPHVVDWVDGSILVIDRATFREVGGFDAGTFMYVDEVAFCLTVADNGGVVMVDPSVVATQVPGAPSRPRAHAYLVTRNQVRVAARRSGRRGAARAVLAGLAFASRCLLRAVAGSAPGRRFHLRSMQGGVEGSIAGARGRSGPPPSRIAAGSDVVLTEAATIGAPVTLLYWGRRGGGARMTFELARALHARDDVDVSLSVSRDVEVAAELAQLGAPIHEARLPSPSKPMIAGAPGLVASWLGLVRRVRRTSDLTVLVAMGSPWSDVISRLLGWLVRRNGGRLVRVVHDATPHPGDSNRSPEWIEREAMRGADTYVALSDHVAEQLVELGEASKRVVRSDLGPFSVGDRRPAVGEPHDPFRFLFFGRLAEYKGIGLLLDAAQVLHDRGVDVDVRVVGDGDLEVVPTSSNVTIDRRWVPEADVRNELVWADAVVLPYTEASQSGVAPMATALGIPTVVTPVGGLVEQIEPDVTAVVADEMHGAALADAMSLLATDRDRYARMARACTEAPSVEAAWGAIVDRLLHDLNIVR